MPTIDNVPLYNLRAVVQDTGLSADALRAWERRYGLPQPGRTSGGHRLYSKRDIDTLKWLIARQEEGLTISKAVSLWNQLNREGQDPLRIPEYVATRSIVDSTALAGGKTVTELRDTWVSACLDFDEQRADGTLAQAFALYPIEFVCIGVLQGGLSRIGMGWYEAEVSVQQEHFASELAIRKLEALVAATSSPTRSARILAACPPAEEHDFGLLLLTLLLKRQGWPVIHLGANVPIEDLVVSTKDCNIRLVVSVAQLLDTAANLAEMAKALEEHAVPLAYGGSVFQRTPGLEKLIPAYYLGDSLEGAPQIVEQLILSPPVRLAMRDVPAPQTEARDLFRTQIPQVEADVEEAMRGEGMQPDYMSSANQELARVIMGAFALGDPSLLAEEIEWLRGRLANLGVAGETIDRYLISYRQSLNGRLHPYGGSILAGLTAAS